MPLAVFFLVRAASFFLGFAPPFLSSLITATLISYFLFLMFHRPAWAWYAIVGEFFLDGNGHFFELFGIALRTWFVGIFLLAWIIRVIQKKRWTAFRLPHPLATICSLLMFSTIFSAARGVNFGHPSSFVVQDAIPFIFLFLVFPAREYLGNWRSDAVYRTYLKNNLPAIFAPFRLQSFHSSSSEYRYASSSFTDFGRNGIKHAGKAIFEMGSKKFVHAYLVGSAVFSLLTLALFSTGIAQLQDPYYKWFRDVAGGKITDVGLSAQASNHFFRIVLPEHLLLVPILLFLIASIIHGREQLKQWIFVAVAMIPFTVNVSRTYFLAFLIGLLFLFSREQWKIWLAVSAGSILLALSIFLVLHLAASRGQSLGFELLSGRFASIAAPETERSAATRQMLLPPIWEQIKKHPVIGEGLGATVTFMDPVTREAVTTRHFDWGYLELWTELGLLGLLAYLALILYLHFSISNPGYRASVIALAFMNITTPALFHVFGAAMLVFLLTQINPTLRPTKSG